MSTLPPSRLPQPEACAGLPASSVGELGHFPKADHSWGVLLDLRELVAGVWLAPSLPQGALTPDWTSGDRDTQVSRGD